ncbi:beta-galactosidase BoGH2A [Abditibacteriota bacterium]|nr:beta-galactosidase BoGH2A [Abditibacteriota bacterium]
MRTPFLFAAILSCSLPLMAAEAPREHRSLDLDWRFNQGDPTGTMPLGQGYTISTWRSKTATGANDMSGLTADPTGADFSDNNGTANVPQRSYIWFRASLEDKAGMPGPRVVRFAGVDDDAVVYLNGQKIAEHQGWSESFDVDVSRAWKAGQTNDLAVQVHNEEGAGGILETGLQIGTIPIPPYLNPTFNDSSWRQIDVPHDFVVENEFIPDGKGDVGHGSKKTGVGWYRKAFALPANAKGKTLWIDFDGAFRNTTVYLNGTKLGSWRDGYAPFRFDISKAANYGGSNLLAVRTDATANEGWWYEGGGIYRHVWLTIANPLHIAPWGVRVGAKLPEPNNGVVAPAQVSIQTELRNDAATAQNAVVESILVAPNGQVAATVRQSVSVAPNSTKIVAQSATLPKPQLWSIETPRLYRVATRVLKGAEAIDNLSNTFGVRTIRFDAADGFFLNGKRVKIKGTCNHQDFAGVGVAIPDSILDWRIKTLKGMGSNAYRTSHNPVAQELLDACDRQGMIVMDETRHLGDATGAKTAAGTKADDLSELKMMVKRDRNHPSIVIWSMANEEGLQSTADGARIFKAMKVVTDGLDGTRPVSAAMNGGHTPEGFHSVQDIEGFNYDIGSYDNFHNRFPTMPMYGSETASAVATRGEYVDDKEKGYVSNYDQRGGGWANSAQDAWKALATRPFAAGGFVWTGFDYRGEPTPYGWPCINSHFGIIDMCGFPKDPYYYYQAWWGNKPIVHSFPDWNAAGKTAGQDVRVWVYGNAQTIELRLNGKSIGSKAMPPYEHVEWNVPYAPGVLEVRGYDAAGQLVATERNETTGRPAALRLTPDRTALKADGQDATVLAVSVVDTQGRIVPDSSSQITFAIKGAGRNLGVGNGDPSSHEADKANARRAFHGRALLVLGAARTAGSIQVTASTPGLKSATVSLTAK